MKLIEFAKGYDEMHVVATPTQDSTKLIDEYIEPDKEEEERLANTAIDCPSPEGHNEEEPAPEREEMLLKHAQYCNMEDKYSEDDSDGDFSPNTNN